MLTIQNQTRAGKIFKCTIFVGYGGVIFFTGVAPPVNFTGAPVKNRPFSYTIKIRALQFCMCDIQGNIANTQTSFCSTGYRII